MHANRISADMEGGAGQGKRDGLMRLMAVCVEEIHHITHRIRGWRELGNLHLLIDVVGELAAMRGAHGTSPSFGAVPADRHLPAVVGGMRGGELRGRRQHNYVGEIELLDITLMMN